MNTQYQELSKSLETLINKFQKLKMDHEALTVAFAASKEQTMGTEGELQTLKDQLSAKEQELAVEKARNEEIAGNLDKMLSDVNNAIKLLDDQ